MIFLYNIIYNIILMINLALANNLICCPNDSKHSFKDIDNWIDHLSICTSENMAVKYYVCRFDHHHWFLTQKVFEDLHILGSSVA